MSLYKETLMSHFRDPKYKFKTENPKLTQNGFNPSCGDDLTLYIGTDNKISYTGNGCAISMASADIMCTVFNKQIEKEVIDKFINAIKGDEEFNFDRDFEILNVFKEMQEYPARQGCAILPWNTLKKLI